MPHPPRNAGDQYARRGACPRGRDVRARHGSARPSAPLPRPRRSTPQARATSERSDRRCTLVVARRCAGMPGAARRAAGLSRRAHAAPPRGRAAASMSMRARRRRVSVCNVSAGALALDAGKRRLRRARRPSPRTASSLERVEHEVSVPKRSGNRPTVRAPERLHDRRGERRPRATTLQKSQSMPIQTATRGVACLGVVR